METRKRRFERAIQILRVISDANESDPSGLPNKYDIWKALEPMELGTEPTILAAISELEEAGIIYPRHVDEHARGGRPSKHYDLTFDGLWLLLAGVQQLGWKKAGFRKGASFSMLARRYRDLVPEIFGLWEKFEERDIAGVVQRGMMAASTSAWGPPEEFDENMHARTRRRPEKLWSSIEQQRRQAQIDEMFAWIAWIGSSKKAEVQRFRNALAQDPELAAPYLAYLNRKKAEAERWLEAIEVEIREIRKN